MTFREKGEKREDDDEAGKEARGWMGKERVWRPAVVICLGSLQSFTRTAGRVVCAADTGKVRRCVWGGDQREQPAESQVLCLYLVASE